MGSSPRRSLAVAILAAAFAALVLGTGACSGKDTPPPGNCAKPGGPVEGAADDHCKGPDGGAIVQPTTPASCHSDGGAANPDGGTPPWGATLYNAEGDDDDCKYHVKMSVSTLCENKDVTLTLVATRRADGTAATGAQVDAEVFLSDTHPAPNSGATSVENPPGTYRIGPIHFDRPGRWTARFHLYETCDDVLEDSPHGHAAFYLDVP